MGIGLREHMDEHVGSCFFLPEKSALIPYGTDRGFFRQTAPVFPQLSQGLGAAVNKFQSFIA